MTKGRRLIDVLRSEDLPSVSLREWFRPGPSRDTFAKWPKPCELVINIDPDEYPTQTTCDRCGWREYEHPASR
jgi:hypothetical protein